MQVARLPWSGSVRSRIVTTEFIRAITASYSCPGIEVEMSRELELHLGLSSPRLWRTELTRLQWEARNELAAFARGSVAGGTRFAPPGSNACDGQCSK